MSTTGERLIEKRLQRMREGKAACEIAALISDPEQQIALVPLTEGEFDAAQKAAIVTVNSPSSAVELALYEREFRRNVILRSAREVSDLTKVAFDSMQQIHDALEHVDIEHLWEEYRTMSEDLSPSVERISPEELDTLKKAFVEADWNALSGKSLSLLTRFLGSISEPPHRGS